MKKLFTTALLLTSHTTLASEILTITKADHSFDTHIRVGIPAQIVEAPDASLVGKNAPYIQSLRYTASKQLLLNLQFSSPAEINIYMRDQLCKEIHEVTLNPIRDLGTKGTNSLIAKMKAKMITVSGVNTSTQAKAFTQTIVCK